ncbi:hypothetical protein Y1Q_0002068 [Alligator mississippiensis]|uniref:Uncharacterized protein n=1 Tax=Alligator mississippiensis TaxID=8496 RepID=A0A151MIV5_ALLMI|nr:hypothetical protein Y1Q_0002068 [Alligator mississippiensis]
MDEGKSGGKGKEIGKENCSETGMMESRVFKVLGLQPCENSEVDSLALYSELIRAGLEPAGLLYPRLYRKQSAAKLQYIISERARLNCFSPCLFLYR